MATIEKIEHLTDSLKDELIVVWEKSVRSSHHFLSEEDLEYYRPRIRDIYFDAVKKVSWTVVLLIYESIRLDTP
jgi:hypothetical protein